MKHRPRSHLGRLYRSRRKTLWNGRREFVSAGGVTYPALPAVTPGASRRSQEEIRRYAQGGHMTLGEAQFRYGLAVAWGARR